MCKKKDIPSLFDNVTKDLYEKAKYEIQQEEQEEDIEELYTENYKDKYKDECNEKHEEHDEEYRREDDERLNGDCIEKTICQMLKSEKNILCCMEEMFCRLSEEIDNLESTEKKVILYDQLICAYAQKECSMAKLVKSLQKLKSINNCRIRPCYHSPFKGC